MVVGGPCRHDYEEGIFTGGNSTNPDLDHLVQLVGYGEDNGQQYWQIRNSWTPLWGDHGYIRLLRTTNCGIDVTPLDGNGCAGGPPTVKVCGQNGMLFDAGEILQTLLILLRKRSSRHCFLFSSVPTHPSTMRPTVCHTRDEILQYTHSNSHFQT